MALHILTEGKTETTRFLWQGLRMLQEQKADLYSLYIYEQGSYAPLARVHTEPNQPDAKPKRYYYHTDQIGTPLEVTDDTGGMVWRAYYKTWGALEALARSLLRSTGGTIYELFEAYDRLMTLKYMYTYATGLILLVKCNACTSSYPYRKLAKEAGFR